MNWTICFRLLGFYLFAMYGTITASLVFTDLEYQFNSSDIAYIMTIVGLSLIVGSFGKKKAG